MKHLIAIIWYINASNLNLSTIQEIVLKTPNKALTCINCINTHIANSGGYSSKEKFVISISVISFLYQLQLSYTNVVSSSVIPTTKPPKQPRQTIC